MAANEDSEKFAQDEAVTVVTRAVAFNRHGGDVHDKALHPVRPKGVEMKREMTKEDKELADAGYEHLNQQKTIAQKTGNAKLDTADIHEHQLSFNELQTQLNTAFDAKDPNVSPGLSSDEAKARLVRDGQNILTPPKKKSALRKVRVQHPSIPCTSHAHTPRPGSTTIALVPCSTSCS